MTGYQILIIVFLFGATLIAGLNGKQCLFPFLFTLTLISILCVILINVYKSMEIMKNEQDKKNVPDVR